MAFKLAVAGRYGLVVAESADPIEALGAWLTEARQSEGRWSDALVLATATLEGRPSLRAVMLRGIDAAGLIFFTDDASRKGRELAENPRSAALFVWPQSSREVQVEGTVTRLQDTEADAVFADRPADRRAPLWAWRQDTEIDDPLDLTTRLAETRQAMAGREMGRPPYWVGFRLHPDVVEFWQERPEGCHERRRYHKVGGAWSMQWLAP